MSTSKILITGASGFVGSFLVEEALNRGLEVHAGVRSTSSKKYLTDPRIHFFNNDFSNLKQLEDDIAHHQFDYVIHNAGVVGAPKAETYFQVNTGYTKDFGDIIQQTSPTLKKFTYISSIAAYGPADDLDSKILKNESNPNPLTNYGRSKLASEKYLKNDSALPYIIVRPTAVFGPRERDLFQVFQGIKRGLAIQPGFEEQQLTFIYIKDLTRVILDATLSDKKRKEYFISDGNTYSLKNFNTNIAEALNKNILSLRIPIWFLKVIGYISQVYTSVTSRSAALNLEKVQELKARNWRCDISPLKEDYSFEPQYPLATAVKETAEWYKNNNWL